LISGGGGSTFSLFIWLSTEAAENFLCYFHTFFWFDIFWNRKGKNDNIERFKKKLD